MAESGTVVLGCDSNGMNDQEFLNAVQSKLESAGYTVEALGIAPGPFAEYSYSSNAQGKYGVYLMADSTVSIADYHFGANASGNSFKMAVFGIRTDCIPKLESGWDTIQLSPDADCTSVCDKLAYKTYPQMEEICKSDTRIVHANTGDKMGDEVVKALGGQTQDSGEGGEPSTIKDAIKDVLSGWEGEVEAYVRDMTMYIHKIKLPEQNTYLLLSEQHNIEYNSVTIKDYCPNNKNKLIVHWSGGEDIIIQDNKRIERFGEKEWEMEATKKVLKEEAPEETTTSSSDTSNNSDTSSDSDSSDTSKTTTDDNKKTEENNSVGYVEVPVETEEEALEFAHLEWNKNKRESCHSIELTTIGSDRWEIGRWAYVYLPSFDIEEYYYISRASSNISPTEWKTSLTLVPYPPKVENDVKEESEENNEEDTKEDETKTDENNNSSSTSDE